MHTHGIEFLLQILLLLFYAAVAVSLTGLGIVIEYHSILLSATDPTLGLWTSAVGLGAFGLAYLVLKRKLLPLVQVTVH